MDRHGQTDENIYRQKNRQMDRQMDRHGQTDENIYREKNRQMDRQMNRPMNSDRQQNLLTFVVAIRLLANFQEEMKDVGRVLTRWRLPLHAYAVGGLMGGELQIDRWFHNWNRKSILINNSLQFNHLTNQQASQPSSQPTGLPALQPAYWPASPPTSLLASQQSSQPTGQPTLQPAYWPASPSASLLAS